MQNFTIENVPYARKSATLSRLASFPFDVLERGQRFFVPDSFTPAGRLRPIPVKAANALLAPMSFRAQRGVSSEGIAGRYVYRVDIAEWAQ